jgi:hypothetical protein
MNPRTARSQLMGGLIWIFLSASEVAPADLHAPNGVATPVSLR